MTNWWKLREWIAEKKAAPVTGSPYEYLEKMIFDLVDKKIKELDSEECCASLTAAGY